MQWGWGVARKKWMDSVLQELLNLCTPHLLTQLCHGQAARPPLPRHPLLGLQQPQTPAPLAHACCRSQCKAGNGEHKAKQTALCFFQCLWIILQPPAWSSNKPNLPLDEQAKWLARNTATVCGHYRNTGRVGNCF